MQVARQCRCNRTFASSTRTKRDYFSKSCKPQKSVNLYTVHLITSQPTRRCDMNEASSSQKRERKKKQEKPKPKKKNHFVLVINRRYHLNLETRTRAPDIRRPFFRAARKVRAPFFALLSRNSDKSLHLHGGPSRRGDVYLFV